MPNPYQREGWKCILCKHGIDVDYKASVMLFWNHSRLLCRALALHYKTVELQLQIVKLLSQLVSFLHWQDVQETHHWPLREAATAGQDGDLQSSQMR
uniref:Putative ribosomal protein s18c n=1 Tax=Ixodes ricinus TaxID=34613 RepID=A0A0K8RDE9_IXORI